MKVNVDGVLYDGEEIAIGPNLAKYDKRILGIKGPRGAYYMLSQSVLGRWTMLAMTGNRIKKNLRVVVEVC